MDWASVLGLAGVLVAIAGVYVPARIQIKASKTAKLEQLKRDRAAEFAEAVRPYQEQVTQLHEAQDEVIENAVKLWRSQAAAMERDRDYWRRVAMGRAVSLEKQDNEDRRQDDTDHDNREDTP